MKVIDLLNKIANGEEVPLKIKVKGDEYRKSNGQFWCDETEMYLIDNCTSIYNLNDEVEIIEEDKKIRKLDFIEENTFSKRQNGMTSEDRRLLDSNFRELGNKINEIIDYLEENK